MPIVVVIVVAVEEAVEEAVEQGKDVGTIFLCSKKTELATLLCLLRFQLAMSNKTKNDDDSNETEIMMAS